MVKDRGPFDGGVETGSRVFTLIFTLGRTDRFTPRRGGVCLTRSGRHPTAADRRGGSCSRDSTDMTFPAPAPGDVPSPLLPRLSRIHLPRPRITRELADDWPVVLLHAPSGYGKTAALAEWARAADARRVWISLDAATATPEGFAPRLAAALAAVGVTGVGNPRPRDGMGAFADAIDDRVDIVVDAQGAAIDPALAAGLHELVRRTPAVQLRLATRTLTRFDDLRAGLSVDTRIIQAHELAFTLEETRALAERIGVPATEARLAGLQRATGGWPFAVRAAVQVRRRRDAASSREAWVADRGFDDGLAFARSFVLDELLAVERFESVVPAAGLETFTIEQAHAIGADALDASTVDELEHRGLGAWEIDGVERRFRLQPLLRDALLSRLSAPDRMRIHQRLARWHAADDTVRAFEAAVAGEDWAFAAELARGDFTAVAGQLGRNPGAFGDIPRSALRQEPILGVLSGLGDYIQGNVFRAVRTFALVVSAGEQIKATWSSETTVDQVWVQGVMTVALRLLGRYELLPTALRSFQRMVGRVDDPAALESSDELFMTQVASTEILLDRLPDAAATLAGRSRLERRGASRIRPVYPASLAAFVAAQSGDLVGAASLVRSQLTAGAPESARSSFLLAPLHLAEALVAIERLDAEAALAALELVRPHWPSIEMWPLVLHTEGLAIWSGQGPDAALDRLLAGREEKTTRPSIGPRMAALLDALHAELLLAVGRTAEAEDVVTPWRRREYPRLAIPAARRSLLVGDPEFALGTAERAARRAPADRPRLEALTIAASAAHRLGHAETAENRFRAAVQLADRSGMRLPLIAMPREDFTTLADRHGAPDAIRAAVEPVTPGFPSPGDLVPLTRRERVVLVELAAEASSAELAQRLNVSVNTVKTQIRSLSRKLGVSGRAQLLAEARRRRIL